MKRHFASLDRHTVLDGEYDRPDRYRQIYDAAADGRVIARGAGVSYVGASFGGGARSIDMHLFDRILAFDADAHTIVVEAGISLGKLFEFLTPHGLHLPVQPGHPQITVGGCIAANVHGKNQYAEGTFRTQVESLTLYHPDHGTVAASPDDNAEVFELTVGGYGLTGIILAATLRLAPLPGFAIREERLPVGGLAEAFREIDRLKADYDMIYCWNDLARRGADAGRGYIVAGSYIADAPRAEARARYRPLDPSAARRLRPAVFGDAAMPWVNRLYYRLNTRSAQPRTVPLFAFLYPAVGKELYFDFFGRCGFIEMQVLLPADGIESHVGEFLDLLRRHGRPVALTTIKAVSGAQRLLHFDGAGFNFTIEMRNAPENMAFLAALDALNTRHGGITNIIKDSRLSAETVRQQYPGYDAFRERLHRYDPARRFASALSERLGL